MLTFGDDGDGGAGEIFCAPWYVAEAVIRLTEGFAVEAARFQCHDVGVGKTVDVIGEMFLAIVVGWLESSRKKQFPSIPESAQIIIRERNFMRAGLKI